MCTGSWTDTQLPFLLPSNSNKQLASHLSMVWVSMGRTGWVCGQQGGRRSCGGRRPVSVLQQACDASNYIRVPGTLLGAYENARYAPNWLFKGECCAGERTPSRGWPPGEPSPPAAAPAAGPASAPAGRHQPAPRQLRPRQQSHPPPRHPRRPQRQQRPRCAGAGPPTQKRTGCRQPAGR